MEKLELKENEEIVSEIHHHPMIIIPHLVISFLILVLDFFLMYWLFLQGWWGAVLFGSVILVVIFYVLRLIFLYKRNNFIITSERLIDYEQPSFFERFKNELLLRKIKSVEAKKSGIGGMIFNYGNIVINIVDDVAPLEIYKISKPLEVQKELLDLLDHSEDQIKEELIKDDPLNLVLAETKLLSIEQKEHLIERIGQQIDLEQNSVKASTTVVNKGL